MTDRDQLAEALECANWCNSNYPGAPGCDCLDAHRRPQADALLRVIAANQRVTIGDQPDDERRWLMAEEIADRYFSRYDDEWSDLRTDVAAALASPAPGEALDP